jgi:quercetin dioxygenase-like cupin family protein/uncharacterized protein YndB with AHSA1/START domain
MDMAHAREVLHLDPLGVRVEILKTAEDTGGELLEMDVIGHPRGFLDQRHVHPIQSERLEMISGEMKVSMNGHTRVVSPGEWIEIPAGTPHTQVPVGDGSGHVRIQVRPAASTRAFLEGLARLCAEGQIGRSGFPRPRAAAELILNHADAGHSSVPPLRVQRAIAKTVLRLAGISRPYVFVDEWDVAAPREAVFDAIADARSYPRWWRPVYIDVQADGPARVGLQSRQHFKGRLPYHLRTRSTITQLAPPRSVTAEVEGDLRGTGTWTLTETADGTHVRFDWQVHADRLLLRVLTPLLRPLLRANHRWAIARAKDGLEPYARTHSASYGPASSTSARPAGTGALRPRSSAAVGGEVLEVGR